MELTQLANLGEFVGSVATATKRGRPMRIVLLIAPLALSSPGPVRAHQEPAKAGESRGYVLKAGEGEGSLMDLTQLANLGEFVGGVAVLVTLVYLAIQVRSNTVASRYAARQALTHQNFENTQMWVAEPALTMLQLLLLPTPNE